MLVQTVTIHGPCAQQTILICGGHEKENGELPGLALLEFMQLYTYVYLVPLQLP